MPDPRLSPAAVADLRNIQVYSRQRFGVDVARSYSIELVTTMKLLGERPMIGRAEAGLSNGVRSFPSGSHRIYYRGDDAMVDVLRVLHRSQDAPAAFVEKQ